MNLKEFNPLSFLASVGAGGIAVIPFAYLQNVVHQGKGLVTLQGLTESGAVSPTALLLLSLVMIIFGSIHIGLSINLFAKWFGFVKSEGYKKLKNDPLKNGALMVPVISAAMTMNVFIADIRFFIPGISSNFQSMMLPAMLGWSALWLSMMYMEISLLKVKFTKDFDAGKISFGWLLHPFALGMVTVTGTGIAAMSQDIAIADTAALMSAVSGSMGLFLFAVKLISIFTSHFRAPGIPERQFMPSFLIVVPVLTLFAISFFRFSHYMEHRFAFDMHWFFALVMVAGFAFETWYMAFGIAMLKDYFKKDFFKREYYVTLWAFICPFVAYSVLATFLYKTFLPNPAFEVITLLSGSAAIVFFGFVGRRALIRHRLSRIDVPQTNH